MVAPSAETLLLACRQTCRAKWRRFESVVGPENLSIAGVAAVLGGGYLPNARAGEATTTLFISAGELSRPAYIVQGATPMARKVWIVPFVVVALAAGHGGTWSGSEFCEADGPIAQRQSPKKRAESIKMPPPAWPPPATTLDLD